MVVEHSVVVDGLRIHIVESGSGKPLLLLHGLGGPQMWERVIGPLSATFRVIVPDLPGFADSQCGSVPYSTDHFAEFIVQLLDTLELATATIAGISYGAQIAVSCAYRFPQRTDRLVLIAATGLSAQRGVALNDIRWSMFSGFMKRIVLRSQSILEILSRGSFYDIRNRPQDLVERFYRQLLDEAKKNSWLIVLRNVFTPSPDFRQQVAGLRQPVLILWGEHDRAVSSKFAREFHRLIPQSTLHTIPECGHSMPLEKPDEVCEAIIRFAGVVSPK
jgi:pimeloyl-ACP methyl ester carboxylesterase